MESYQRFLLGIMVELTPSLLVLSVLLVRSVDQPAGTNHSGESALTPSADRSADQAWVDQSWAHSHHKAAYREPMHAGCVLPAARGQSP